MKNRFEVVTGVLFTVVLCFSNISAQDQPPAQPKSAVTPKQISGGVLNGKATSLPKPAYPPAARAVNAEGAVSVQVLIDEEGNVVSANAVSGHPLLRAAAVEAARGAKFSPTRLMGEPVKVSGVITYNFVGSVTMAGIGYEIAFAERSGMFAPYFYPGSLAARMPEDWKAEKEVMNSLSFAEPEVLAENRFSVSGAQAATTSETNQPETKYTAVGNTAYSQGKLTTASVGALRNLQLTIRERLAVDPKQQWHFRLGTALGVFVAEIEDTNKMAFNVGEIEQLTATAPSSIPNLLNARLAKFVEFCKSADGTPQSRQMLIAGAQGLRNIRIQ